MVQGMGCKKNGFEHLKRVKDSTKADWGGSTASAALVPALQPQQPSIPLHEPRKNASFTGLFCRRQPLLKRFVSSRLGTYYSKTVVLEKLARLQKPLHVTLLPRPAQRWPHAVTKTQVTTEWGFSSKTYVVIKTKPAGKVDTSGILL